MSDEFTEEQRAWIERYAYTMSKAGELNRCDPVHYPKAAKGIWQGFCVQYHGYVADVPEEVRKSFRWNGLIEDTYKIFSESKSELIKSIVNNNEAEEE